MRTPARTGSGSRPRVGEVDQRIVAEAGAGCHFVGVDGPALHAAEDEPGEGPRRRGLVEDGSRGSLRVRAQSVRGLTAALAVEGEGGEITRRQLMGMQVPALVETALERAAHEPGVQRPRLRGALTDGEDVRRSVRQADAGARHGELHELFGQIGGGMIQRLVVSGYPERGGVVVGAEVQRRDSPGSRLAAAARAATGRRRPGRAAASRPALRSARVRSGSPCARSSAAATSAIASTWAVVLTFGRVSTRPPGRPPASIESTDEQVEGAQAPGASGGLQRLEADADERRRCAGGHGLATWAAARTASASSTASPRSP